MCKLLNYRSNKGRYFTLCAYYSFCTYSVGTYINTQLSSKHVFQDTEHNGEIKRVPILQRFCIAIFLTCLYKRITILISPIYYYYYYYQHCRITLAIFGNRILT